MRNSQNIILDVGENATNDNKFWSIWISIRCTNSKTTIECQRSSLCPILAPKSLTTNQHIPNFREKFGIFGDIATYSVHFLVRIHYSTFFVSYNQPCPRKLTPLQFVLGGSLASAGYSKLPKNKFESQSLDVD